MTTTPFGIRLAYALPAFALAVVGIPIYVYLPKFYTDVIGVDIATLGAIILLMRLFDAVSDPMIGLWSDRTRHGLGRRRPWMLFALIPLVVSLLLICNPPALGSEAGAWWFGTTLFAVFLFWTCVAVPYESLGPEISMNYHERTSILGLRDGLLILGTIAAAASPLLIAQLLGLDSSPASERTKFSVLSWVYAPLLIAFVVWCVWLVRERAPAKTVAVGAFSPATLIELSGNRPFVILLASYTVTAIGSNLPATLIPFYVQYVIGDPNAEGFLLAYFVVGVALLPLWVWYAKRVGKKAAWLTAGSINAVAFAAVFSLGPGDSNGFLLLVVLSGIGFGATLALPSSMQADVIDYEELRSGKRREGEIIGIWSVAKKLAAAFGVGIALPILGLVGYEPNVEQSELVQWTLRALYALVPSLLTIMGLLIAISYPIDQQKHEAILQAIADRRAGRPFADPFATKNRSDLHEVSA